MSVRKKEGRMRITEVNPHLICALCGGYLIDATTIVECLHSFCKTCIMRYLETSKYCPICEVLIHKTRPWQNIRLDDTLQNIVYKLVPGLFQREMKRRREYYDNQPVPSKCVGKTRSSGRIIFSAEEEFSISLEFWPEGPQSIEISRQSKVCQKFHDRRYLLCPAELSMELLKKFIRNKFSLSDRYQIDIYHSNQPLRDHFTLIDVAYIYSWRREGILRLFYAFYLNEAKKMKTDYESEVTITVDNIKMEPVLNGKETFDTNISILESEKKVVQSSNISPSTNGDTTQTINNELLEGSDKTEPISDDTCLKNDDNSDIDLISKNTESNDVSITERIDLDDDDDDEGEMQIVMEEVEIEADIHEDSESNLEIDVEDKSDDLLDDVATPPVPQPEQTTQDQEHPKTENLITKVPNSRSPDIKENHTDRTQLKNSNISADKSHRSTESKPEKSEAPKTPTKSPGRDTITFGHSKSNPKDLSLHIPKATIKDTASQVLSPHKEHNSRPPPSPVRESSYRYSTPLSERRDSSSKSPVSSPKDSHPRIVLTLPKDPQYRLSFKESNHEAKKESRSSKESTRSIPPLSKDIKSSSNNSKDVTPSKSIASYYKDGPRSTTSLSNNISSHMTLSSNREPFTRPLPSPKKETAGHSLPSPKKTSSPSLHSLNSSKDSSRIPNAVIKDTAALVGKHQHKESHTHTVKSMIKDSVQTQIKHVPQVPRLVKTPIQQIKPPTPDPYSSHAHNLIPKWQLHREGLYNGHYKPPQEKPLELKREPVPLDYSKQP